MYSLDRYCRGGVAVFGQISTIFYDSSSPPPLIIPPPPQKLGLRKFCQPPSNKTLPYNYDPESTLLTINFSGKSLDYVFKNLGVFHFQPYISGRSVIFPDMKHFSRR